MAAIQPYAFEPKKRVIPEGSDSSDSESDVDMTEFEEAQDRIGNTNWCCCGNCRPMTTEQESICCQEMSRFDDKLEEDDVQCITEHQSFDVVCKHNEVLRTALIAMHDVRSDSLSEPLSNRMLRLAGYRQFTWWVHTRLGKSVRLVIPSCAVWGIRDAYPEPRNTFTGFKDVEEERDSDFPS